MAETKTKPQPQEVAKANSAQINAAVALNGKTISREDALKALSEMEEGELDSGYLEFEPGETRRVIFLGWKDIPGLGSKKGMDVPAALFLVDNGKEQINADSVIISYFEKQMIGVARQIVCTGKKDTPNGTYKTFKIYELTIKK